MGCLLCFLAFAVQIRFSRCRSWWTVGFQGRWTLSFRLCSCAPCCSSGSVFIMASGFRWVLYYTSTLNGSVSFVAHYESYFVCFYVVSTGREEMPDVLPAQADHCRSSVALGGYPGHMANVSLTSLATSSLIQTVTYNGAFSEFAGLMNSKTLPISIKWT